MSVETTRPQTFAGSQFFFFSRAEISQSRVCLLKMFASTKKNCSCMQSSVIRSGGRKMLCLLLTSCCFVWGPSTGGWWWFIIHHPRKDCFVHQRGMQRTNNYFKYHNHWIWRQACCKCKSTCVVSFAFFSVIIRTVSRRVFFFLRNKFQRTNIFIGI